MSSDLVFIHDDVLSDVADAIRFVEGSSAGIAPEDYANHIKALDNRILQPDVLNFYMPNGGTISLNKIGSPTVVELEYWLDDNGRWIVWQPDNNGNRSLVLSAGQRMYVRNTSDTSTGFTLSANHNYNFSFTTDTYAEGNINSLLCKNPQNAILSELCYYNLFANAKIVTAPELPSTILANACYYAMFLGCVNLVSPPKELPATSLTTSCYHYMFYGCSSLIIPDDFVLPAQTLADYSYYNMFRECTNVNLIRTYMTDISASNCLTGWLGSVSQTGDFYCPAELTISEGASGIPSGWTRHDI